jgi:hypothetical protein
MTKVGCATVGTKSMKPAASTTMKATTASTVKAATASATMPAPTAMPGDCRNVRLDAKRESRNARCQNAYYFLLHDAFPTSKS